MRASKTEQAIIAMVPSDKSSGVLPIGVSVSDSAISLCKKWLICNMSPKKARRADKYTYNTDISTENTSGMFSYRTEQSKHYDPYPKPRKFKTNDYAYSNTTTPMQQQAITTGTQNFYIQPEPQYSIDHSYQQMSASFASVIEPSNMTTQKQLSMPQNLSSSQTDPLILQRISRLEEENERLQEEIKADLEKIMRLEMQMKLFINKLDQHAKARGICF